MADTKRGREKQARDESNRQRERDVAEARERSDESEPAEAVGDEGDERPRCHRRGCDELATFLVTERYLEDTGHGAVTAEAHLCTAHTEEESPVNLDGVYEDYVFRVAPI